MMERVSSVQDPPSPARPALITVLCLIGFAGAVMAVPVVFPISRGGQGPGIRQILLFPNCLNWLLCGFAENAALAGFSVFGARGA